MEIGVVHPGLELGGTKSALAEIGSAVEAAGFDHITLYDHVLGAAHDGRDPPLIGYATERDPFNDPFVAFGFLAGITSRIKFVTGVLVLPQRQTALAAKQAADVDLLSEGRLRLGVGIGWNYVEYEALGQNFGTRGRRVEEQIGLLRKLWSERLVSFEGAFDRIDRAGISPQPVQPIPIYCGGGTEPAYERAARIADGFIFFGPTDFCLTGLDSVRGHLARIGRSEQGFAFHLVMRDSTETSQQVADNIRRWEDGGGTAVSLNSMGRGMNSTAAHIDFISSIGSH